MLKFAFIINVPGESPETYSAVYENEESYSIIAGTGDMNMAKDYVKKLADDGFTLFNLCGDFDDEITEQMQEMAGDSVKIRHANYNLNELVKLDRLRTMRNYGVIIVMDGVEKPHEVVLRSKECDTRAIFVKDMPQARRAARRLVEKRVNFIELCSWFDTPRLEIVVKAIDGVVPIGTCGEL
ncbi:MAG: DUF6506 family protein [Bacillota bacterium]|nr:DUF6506 family protein [Bacillota bacterium]